MFFKKKDLKFVEKPYNVEIWKNYQIIERAAIAEIGAANKLISQKKNQQLYANLNNHGFIKTRQTRLFYFFLNDPHLKEYFPQLSFFLQEP